jgi:hypothetical protein
MPSLHPARRLLLAGAVCLLLAAALGFLGSADRSEGSDGLTAAPVLEHAPAMVDTHDDVAVAPRPVTVRRELVATLALVALVLLAAAVTGVRPPRRRRSPPRDIPVGLPTRRGPPLALPC